MIAEQKWIVGVDGSDGSRHAALWAAPRAAERHDADHPVQLRLVRSWDTTSVGLGGLASPDAIPSPPAHLSDETQALHDRLVTDDVSGGAPIGWSVERGSAAGVLLDLAADADLLVVGSRGLGGFKRLVLGSVSQQVATHSTVPAIVVPASANLRSSDLAQHNRIVVGMDGSENSKAALRWAISFATPSSTVAAVGVWQPSPLATAADEPTFPDLAAESEAQFKAAVAEVLESMEPDLTQIDLRVTSEFWYANTVETLLREGASAELLVVGSQGQGRIGAALLGSVSNKVLHQTSGPVAVVPLS